MRSLTPVLCGKSRRSAWQVCDEPCRGNPIVRRCKAVSRGFISRRNSTSRVTVAVRGKRPVKCNYRETSGAFSARTPNIRRHVASEIQRTQELLSLLVCTAGDKYVAFASAPAHRCFHICSLHLLPS